MIGNQANGCCKTKRTVWSSTTSVLLIELTTPRPEALTSGLRTASKVNLTSAAVRGVPSCQRTPGLSLKVYWVRSGLASHDSARSGTTSISWPLSRYWTRLL